MGTEIGEIYPVILSKSVSYDAKKAGTFGTGSFDLR